MRNVLLAGSLCAICVVASSCRPAEKASTKPPPQPVAKPATTQIRLDGVTLTEKQFYNIYRSSQPITKDNFRQAELIAARISADQPSYTAEVKNSGTAYYLITTCDVWGRETRAFN